MGLKFLQKTQILRRAKALETSTGRDTGGRLVAGSGNQIGNKGDVEVGGEKWLAECKSTAKPRFTMTLAIWRQVEKQAMRDHKEAVVILEIAGRRLAVVDYNVWISWRDQGM